VRHFVETLISFTAVSVQRRSSFYLRVLCLKSLEKITMFRSALSPTAVSFAIKPDSTTLAILIWKEQSAAAINWLIISQSFFANGFYCLSSSCMLVSNMFEILACVLHKLCADSRHKTKLSGTSGNRSTQLSCIKINRTNSTLQGKGDSCSGFKKEKGTWRACRQQVEGT